MRRLALPGGIARALRYLSQSTMARILIALLFLASPALASSIGSTALLVEGPDEATLEKRLSDADPRVRAIAARVANVRNLTSVISTLRNAMSEIEERGGGDAVASLTTSDDEIARNRHQPGGLPRYFRHTTLGRSAEVRGPRRRRQSSSR